MLHRTSDVVISALIYPLKIISACPDPLAIVLISTITIFNTTHNTESTNEPAAFSPDKHIKCVNKRIVWLKPLNHC